MKSSLTLARPISVSEKEVLRATLEADKKSQQSLSLLGQIDGLSVVNKCDCGCDSVDFVGFSQNVPRQRVANGIGITPTGGKVGIIIWGVGDKITGLEVYSEGAKDDDIKLPIPSSIHSWTSGAV